MSFDLDHYIYTKFRKNNSSLMYFFNIFSIRIFALRLLVLTGMYFILFGRYEYEYE